MWKKEKCIQNFSLERDVEVNNRVILYEYVRNVVQGHGLGSTGAGESPVAG
jgi:hypothetical protein